MLVRPTLTLPRKRGREGESSMRLMFEGEPLYSFFTASLRTFSTPEPYCSVNVAFLAQADCAASAVFWPLSITVICRPLVVTSMVFHLPAAFGIGLTSAKYTIAPVP